MTSNNRYGEFQDEDLANKNISINKLVNEPQQIENKKPKFLQQAMDNKDVLIINNMASGGNVTEKAQTSLMISINTHLR
jgi:hypothetical protein